MKCRRQILGVDVGLIDSSTPAPDEKWFNVFQSDPTGLTATTSVGRSTQGPAWSWNAGPRHLHCDYGPAEVANDPAPTPLDTDVSVGVRATERYPDSVSGLVPIFWFGVPKSVQMVHDFHGTAT